MRVGVYYNNRKVEVEERSVPEIGAGDVLIKVMASGICGSDILEWYRVKKAPLVLGHELTGEVVDVGKKIDHIKKGDRVFATHHVPCEQCHECLSGHQTACEILQTVNNFDPGGFSEYLRVTGKSVETGILALPEEISYEEGSFIEPLGTVVRGLRNINLQSGESMLVLGCGIAGLLMIKMARILGVGRIIATDINPYRLEAAERYGANHTFRAEENLPSRIMDVNGRLADKVILCAGVLSAAQQALQCVERGGAILFFAVPKPGENIEIDMTPFWRNDIQFMTSYGAAPMDNQQALELIRDRDLNLKEMITHRFPLERIAEGFRAASEEEKCLKVIIKPHR
jgi:L-iditol 2-dehydrogenase